MTPWAKWHFLAAIVIIEVRRVAGSRIREHSFSEGAEVQKLTTAYVMAVKAHKVEKHWRRRIGKFWAMFCSTFTRWSIKKLAFQQTESSA
ncbi:hypothetical protein JB92DRAFT_2883640 [Gautieria morchelliformis]|nr:hypothetical protein JB92DRAFT_2883640 [Gautieria morchelliformis]